MRRESHSFDPTTYAGPRIWCTRTFDKADSYEAVASCSTELVSRSIFPRNTKFISAAGIVGPYKQIILACRVFRLGGTIRGQPGSCKRALRKEKNMIMIFNTPFRLNKPFCRAKDEKCPRRSCAIPYDFKHVLSFTEDGQEFKVHVCVVVYS